MCWSTQKTHHQNVSTYSRDTKIHQSKVKLQKRINKRERERVANLYYIIKVGSCILLVLYRQTMPHVRKLFVYIKSWIPKPMDVHYNDMCSPSKHTTMICGFSIQKKK